MAFILIKGHIKDHKIFPLRQVVMLARKKSSKNGKVIPLEWTEGVGRLLNETYKDQSTKEGRYFDVYGQVFPEEMLLIVSYLSETDQNILPITLYLSADPNQISTVEKVKETQQNFIDLVGLFFDEILSNTDWNEFEPNWQEVTHHHQNYFYKLTRENFNLTLEANRLLGPDFEDVELDEDDLDQ
jgi:hypothetical protein